MDINFGKGRKSTTIVLASGIEAEIMSTLGTHQEMITINDEGKRRNAIDKMLLSCVKRIGDKTELTMKDIEKLLREDRKKALWEIRQLSNENNPEFRFKYEFPVKRGKKLSDVYRVTFDKEDFPAKPYSWVIDKMVEDHIEEKPDFKKTDEAVEKLWKENEWPVMFQSYDEVLEKRTRQFRLPSVPVTVLYDLVDGETETRMSRHMKEEQISSHSYLQLRNCRYKDEEKSREKGKDVLYTLPLNEMITSDIEALRADIRFHEADICTTVVVQYKDDASLQTNLDLVSTSAFFFPSLAL